MPKTGAVPVEDRRVGRPPLLRHSWPPQAVMVTSTSVPRTSAACCTMPSAAMAPSSSPRAVSLHRRPDAAGEAARLIHWLQAARSAWHRSPAILRWQVGLRASTSARSGWKVVARAFQIAARRPARTNLLHSPARDSDERGRWSDVKRPERSHRSTRLRRSASAASTPATGPGRNPIVLSETVGDPRRV